MSVPQLIQFILQHYGPARDWDAVKLFEFVYWAQSNGYALEILNDDNSLVGLVIAYPCMKAEEAEEESDPEGPCIYVPLAIALKPGALKMIGFAILKRFGMRESIAWKHAPFNVTHVYPATMVRRNLLRVTHDNLVRQRE